ncbi:MAG TPA: PHB depolymerase family esterase [Chitinophagales bacterium]|nr:PHB depolymerase family esterase [Chitinophagales bacterium]
MKKALVLFFCTCYLLNCNVAKGGNRQFKNLISGGRLRNYLLVLPSAYNPGLKPALVIALHGLEGTGQSMERLTGFDAVAESENFIVAYPDGIHRAWNDGRGRNENIDDVAFISNLIDTLVASYHIDKKRVYVTGFSNGGFMTMKIACQLQDKVAAVAAVSATVDTAIDNHCGSTPVSIMLIHGTDDPLVSVNGGSVRRLPNSYILSHQQLVKQWVGRDKCNRAPIVDTIQDINHDGTTIIKSVYNAGQANTVVISYIVNGGGHTWPGGPQYLPVAIIGRASHNLNASTAIWAFFKAHPRP